MDSTSRAPDIVCGVNGSPSSRRALAAAVRLASRNGGRVTAVKVYDVAGFFWGALASLPGGDLLPVPRWPRMQAEEEASLRAIIDDVLADPQLAPAGAHGSARVDALAVPGRAVDVLVRESDAAAG